MPSKKKERGKARRAAKAEKEEKKQAAAAASNGAEGATVAAQKQREGESLEERLALMQLEGLIRQRLKETGTCFHSLLSLPEGTLLSDDFVAAFEREAIAAGGSMQNAFEAARVATWDKYVEIWRDRTKMELAISCVMMDGTESILRGNYDAARVIAPIASYFEKFVKNVFHETQATLDWGKLCELYHGDEHTLVSFFRKRIPCKCLDKKYKEVKSITKMGICGNPKCSLPDRKAERSKMLYCTRCCAMNYCSRECQVADWPSHKTFCDIDASRLAVLKTRQKK
jgi:hypothetical protein